MKIVLFYHSLLSDWNHGNAHFLRGIVGELLARGHDVRVYEPLDAWSLQNLKDDYGDEPIKRFFMAYPGLSTTQYQLDTLNLDEALDGAKLVLVHEWNDHDLVRRIGQHRAQRGSSGGSYQLLFHDTHHRAITEEAAIAKYDLRYYDGVLAFGNVLRDLYLKRKWTKRAWTWHEAADPSVFYPRPQAVDKGDLIWIGNWGDEERTAELHEFLLGPVKALGLKARVHGVRYPDHAKQSLAEAGIEYGGWMANFDTPVAFANFKMTVHVPRRPYVKALSGIPTIRVFETLACGIPLICSPWNDSENLFTPGKDYWMAKDGAQMQKHLKTLANEPSARKELADHGLATVLGRHTCAHRVDELLGIHEQLKQELKPEPQFAVPTPSEKPKRKVVARTSRPCQVAEPKEHSWPA